MLPRIFSPATGPTEKPMTVTRLFPFAALGRFLSCLFLGHAASFPPGWIPPRVALSRELMLQEKPIPP
jgi:hypothetical protein